MSQCTPTPSTVDDFLLRFIQPRGNAPEDIKNKILHWIEVANGTGDDDLAANRHELMYIRKRARQNLRRLVAAHPLVAAQISQEMLGVGQVNQ